MVMMAKIKAFLFFTVFLLSLATVSAMYSYSGYGRSYGNDYSGLMGSYSADGYGQGKGSSGVTGKYRSDGYGISYGTDASGLKGTYSDSGYGSGYGKGMPLGNGQYVYGGHLVWESRINEYKRHIRNEHMLPRYQYPVHYYYW